jgi:hypothetical protein
MNEGDREKIQTDLTEWERSVEAMGEAMGEVVDAMEAYQETCADHERRSALVTKWECACVRADCASELAQAMGLKGELGWSAVLMQVRILVGQSDAARKRRLRAKPKAKAKRGRK